MAMTERPWLRQTDNDLYGSHDISGRGNGAYVCFPKRDRQERVELRPSAVKLLAVRLDRL
jgi:hypothetical protein